MKLADLPDQIETVAVFQVIGADQQLVGIVTYRCQVLQAGGLIGDGAGDAGLPPEAPAQGSEQKATFGGHRNAAWDLDRLQTFLRDAMTGIGQKGREIQAPGVAPGWEAN